jgi:hypothetical protein
MDELFQIDTNSYCLGFFFIYFIFLLIIMLNYNISNNIDET